MTSSAAASTTSRTRLTAGYRSRRTCSILYLHQFFVTREGAGGTRSYEFARRFVERGHEVRMVTAGPESPNGRRDRGGGRARRLLRLHARHRHVEPGTHGGLRPLRRRRDAGRAARAAAGRDLRDLAPAHDGAARAAAALRWRAPLVFEVRDLWPEAPIQMGALRNPLRAAARPRARALRVRAQRAPDRTVARDPGRAAAGQDDAGARTRPTSTCSTPHPRPAPSRWPTSARWARRTTSPPSSRPRGSSRTCPFVLMGDGKRRAELERAAPPNVHFRSGSKTDVARLAAESSACLTVFKDVPVLATNSPEQALRHLRGRPAGDREHGRLDARARGAERRRRVRARRRRRRPGREGGLAARQPGRGRGGWARTRGRWPSASSAATSSRSARSRCWRRRRADRALVLRRQHGRARIPAGVPGRHRAHAPGGRGARGARARQRLRRRIGGGRSRAAPGRAPVRARAPHRQGGERLDAPARGARALLPAAERGLGAARGRGAGAARRARGRSRRRDGRRAAARLGRPAGAVRLAAARTSRGRSPPPCSFRTAWPSRAPASACARWAGCSRARRSCGARPPSRWAGSTRTSSCTRTRPTSASGCATPAGGSCSRRPRAPSTTTSSSTDAAAMSRRIVEFHRNRDLYFRKHGLRRDQAGLEGVLDVGVPRARRGGRAPARPRPASLPAPRPPGAVPGSRRGHPGRRRGPQPRTCQ